MEDCLTKSMLQKIQIKKEVLESIESNSENHDYIKDIKQEPYDHDDPEPISGVAIIKLMKEVDLIKKDTDLTYSTKKTTDETYNDDTSFFQTEYGNNILKSKPAKVVTIQVHNENKHNFCHICKKTFFSWLKFQEHKNNSQCREKPYLCHLCNKSYCEMNIFSMHQIIVHGHYQTVPNHRFRKYSKATVMKSNNYVCNSSSSKHKPLDLQKKLLNCVVCNKMFCSKHDLNNHQHYSLIHKRNVLVQSLKSKEC